MTGSCSQLDPTMKLPLPLILLLPLALLPQNSLAESFPSDAGLVNVKSAPYNARGDGVTDDTAAIRAAIAAHVGSRGTLYFPNGTYVISDTLKWVTSGGLWAACLSFQGESRNGTVLKLADNLPDYNTGTKKPMIMTGSTTNGSPGTASGGVEAYLNSFFDLTIDCGSGNANAVGIDYMVNNRGTIRNVTFRSSDPSKRGAIGLALTRAWPGPGLIQDVLVDGFDYGISSVHVQYGITFNKVTLQNQRIYGIDAGAQSFFIENLSSLNSVPAIRLAAGGHVVIINSTLTGGSSSTSAILVSNAKARLFARNITTSGYQSAIYTMGSVVPGTAVGEYVWPSTIRSLFPSPSSSLGLSVEQPPAVYTTSDLAQWANVVSYGAVGGTNTQDDTVAIQAAMNSGKPIVYFPRVPGAYANQYLINQTITVPASVKRIIGWDVSIRPLTAAWPTNAPAFRIQGGTSSDSTTIERFWPGGVLNGGAWVEHSSPRTVVLRDFTLGGGNWGYKNMPGSGKLFMDDCVGAVKLDYPQSVWMRQYNTEDAGRGTVNNGGKLWILGLKTERSFTAITTSNGGSSEILGGFLMPGVGNPDWPAGPLFDNQESSQSLIYTVHGGATNDDPLVHIRETRGGITKDLLRTDVIQLSTLDTTCTMPLFTGYQNTGVPAPWQLRDIGAIGVPGSASYSGGSFSISGSGADIYNSSDAFCFLSQPATGDCDIRARVVSQTNTHGWAKAGVMVRETLDSRSTHAMMSFSPNGIVFIKRVLTGGVATSSTTSAGSLPHWVRVVRSGNTFTGYRSTDGSNWIQVGTATFTMGTSAYIGLAICSHDNAVTSTATLDNVSATP